MAQEDKERQYDEQPEELTETDWRPRMRPNSPTARRCRSCRRRAVWDCSQDHTSGRAGPDGHDAADGA